MQHDHLKLASLQKKESRIRNTKTPDRSDVRPMDMTTLSAVSSPRRRLQSSRQSNASVLNSTYVNLRKLEAENYNLDLELAYNDYIATHMELIIEKESLESTEKSFSNKIKSLCEETHLLHEKCQLIETRIRDVKYNTFLNNYQDKLIQYANNVEDDFENHEVSFILSELKKLLNRFNILRCENILLPNNEEEVQEFKKIFNSCYISLQKISDLVRSLESYTTYHKEFTVLLQEISNFKKITEDEIFNVQSETLKTCSQLFAQDDI